MAELAKKGTPTPSTVGPDAGERLGTFTADVAIAAGDACRLTSTGCTPSSGAAANANARIHGWAGHAAAAGEKVTLWANINFAYGEASDITPGDPLYLSATVAGGLNTSATTGGTVPAAFGLPGGRIRVKEVLA